MKLILTKTVEHLGSIGDVVDVKSGYGRNYLIPHGMALLANPGNQAELEHNKKMLEKKRLQLVAHSEELAAKLNKIKLSFMKKVGASGKLFGTVTAKEVATQLEELGYKLPRKSIQIQGDVKTLGVFAAVIRLPQQVEAEIAIEVVAESADDESITHQSS